MMTKAKTKLFFGHLGFSIVVFVSLFLFIANFWFPHDLIELDGGWQAIKLIAGVDIILGPLLTLFFVHPERKSFKKDFAFVLSVQLAALIPGIYIAYDQRVEYVAFYDGKFVTLSHGAYSLAEKTLLEHEKKFDKVDVKQNTNLKLVYVKPMPTPQIMVDVLNNLPEPPLRPDWFLPLKDKWALIVDRFSIRDKTLLSSIEQMAGLKDYPDKLHIFNLKGRYGEGYMVFDDQIQLKALIAKP